MTALMTLEQLVEATGGSIKTGPFGTQLKAVEYSQEGVPLISVGEILSGALRLRPDTPRVPVEVVERLPEYLLRKGDIVVARKGAVERNAWVRPEEAGWFLGSDAIRVRLGEDCDSRYVAYQMQSVVSQTHLLAHAPGSTMPSMNGAVLGSLPLRVPPLMEQEAVAEVLGALDDKIAANDRCVRASAALRRARLDECLLDGASSVGLGAISEVLTRGKAPKYTDAESALLVLNQKCVRGGIASTEAARRTSHNAGPMLRQGDVLVNSTGQGTLGRVGLWREPAEATIDSHVTLVRFNCHAVEPWVAAEVLLASELQIEALAEGSTGQTELSRAKLAALQLEVPSATIQRELGSVLEALHARERAVLEESLTLAELHDTLLPALMSGQLTVRDAKHQVEAVL